MSFLESVDFARPGCLWLLPLALLPIWRWQRHSVTYPGLSLLPADPLSVVMDWSIRLISASLLCALIIAMAEPYRGEKTLTKVGSGAHVVVLLDRSASMNDDFTRRARTFKGSKNVVARAVLNQIVDGASDDFFGLISFSTSALYMLPLTQDPDVIRAGINSTLNRGRGSTAVHKGLDLALDQFSDSNRVGARVILLVSDGGGIIPSTMQSSLRQKFQEFGVSIYWLYLKSTHGNKLSTATTDVDVDSNPEYFLHHYFSSLDVPYYAYEAEEPDALLAAIDAINELKNQPLSYQETLPRQDLAAYFYWIALVLLVLLSPARILEVDKW